MNIYSTPGLKCLQYSLVTKTLNCLKPMFRILDAGKAVFWWGEGGDGGIGRESGSLGQL